MDVDCNAIERQRPRTKRAAYRSHVTAHPRKPVVPGRNAIGRRLRDLADAFADRLGGWDALSVPVAADVRRAAELVALAEQCRADALRNGMANPVNLIKLEGAADRAVRRLGLEQAMQRRVSLRERLLASEAE
jgi:hypothetical protein